jgi:hypothetical protein
MQVIEKAYKKLRLDALVIQQGRLTQNTSKVGKDDLLSMVKYGAEKVFSSEPAKITDEDIDLIITKGETDTVRLQHLWLHVSPRTLGGGLPYMIASTDATAVGPAFCNRFICCTRVAIVSGLLLWPACSLQVACLCRLL